MSAIEILAPGVAAWTNELGIRTVFHHYTGHPGRRGVWADLESKKYPGGRQGAKWRREQEGDPSARAGDSVWKGFIRERNVIPDSPVRPERDDDGRATGWIHVLGLDPGGQVENAGVFWANRPSPTWAHPDRGPVPILPGGQWVAFAEIYKADIPTQEFKLRLYREAMVYLGVRGFEALNDHVTAVFGDPSGHETWLNFSDPTLACPIRVSIGNEKLKHALNARVEGMHHMNSLFHPQKVCCEIHYYGRDIECERCGHVMPSVPGAVVMERCQNLIREIQIAVRPRARRPVDQPRDGKIEGSVPQHACDASRYALVGGTPIVASIRQRMAVEASARTSGIDGILTLESAMAAHVARMALADRGGVSSYAGDPNA